MQLVVGASGATGRLVVNQLLAKGNKLRIIVRSREKLPPAWNSHKDLQIITASILDLTGEELKNHTLDCTAIISCLGHNMNWNGIYGQPRMLVTEATQRLCQSVIENQPKTPVKYVLMNTSGNQNRDLDEQISFGEKCVLQLLRLLLPPHVDNETAADYLRTQIAKGNEFLEWVVVRPDTLTTEDKVTSYEIHPSPIRSAIFNPGKSSRINVGHFMTTLISNNLLWSQWKGQMPLIYNKIHHG